MLQHVVLALCVGLVVPAMAQQPPAPPQSPPAASPPPCEAFTRNEDQDWVAKRDVTVPGPTGPKQIKAGKVVNDDLQDQLRRSLQEVSRSGAATLGDIADKNDARSRLLRVRAARPVGGR